MQSLMENLGPWGHLSQALAESFYSTMLIGLQPPEGVPGPMLRGLASDTFPWRSLPSLSEKFFPPTLSLAHVPILGHAPFNPWPGSLQFLLHRASLPDTGIKAHLGLLGSLSPHQEGCPISSPQRVTSENTEVVCQGHWKFPKS